MKLVTYTLPNMKGFSIYLGKGRDRGYPVWSWKHGKDYPLAFYCYWTRWAGLELSVHISL